MSPAALYHGMDAATLDREYNARDSVASFDNEQALYVRHSQIVSAEMPHHGGLVYDEVSGEALDLYGAAPGRPLFVWIHGGYWRGGSRADNAFAASGLVRSGVAVAVIDYTLAPAADLDEIVRQVRAAIQWLYRHGADYGLDVSRIHVGGSSAGGHLVGSLLMSDWQQPLGLPQDIIGAALALSGLHDLTPLRHTQVDDWMRFTDTQIAGLSPMAQIPDSSTAHLIASVGGRETSEFRRQTDDFLSAWRKAGHRATRIAMPEHNHFNIALSLKDPDSPLVTAVRAAIFKETRMAPFTAAVAQIASVPDDPKATADKIVRTIHDAAAKDARLIVFPEAVLGGYPKGASFGAPIGLRKPEGRAAFAAYHQAAVDLDGPEIASIAAATAETGVFAVIGCIERDGGTLYCTALYFDGANGLVNTHRKLMPTAGERLIWGFGDGSTLEAVDSPLGRIGAVICWENYMPALRMHMYAQGVTLYCAPTADDRDTWVPTMQHVALEGRCFVLTSCQYITRGAYPDTHESALGDDPDTVMMRGGSAIIDPTGKVIAGPDFEGETVLYAEIDPDLVTRGKYDFDVTGHYARPDIFELRVDDRRKPAVRRASDTDRH